MQLSRTRLVAGVAAATLPLAVLAGCGEDEPQPKFEEPTSASPSESSSPKEPVEPAPPTAMEGDDVNGAKAFVEYYFAVLDRAIATSRTREVASLAADTCSTCAGVTKVINATRQNGGRIVGGTHEVRRVELAPVEAAEGISVFRGNVIVHTTRQVIRDSGVSGVDGEFPAGPRRYSIVVGRDSGGWRLTEWRSM